MFLNSNNSLTIKKTKLYQNIDEYSFISFESEVNEKKETILIIVIVKFSINDKYKFNQSFYEFNIEENYQDIIAELETNCDQLKLDQIKIISDSENSFRTEINKTKILLISKDLDYEIEKFYDLQLHVVCNQKYLMTTKIRVNLIDLNDNSPIFFNPLFSSNQTFYAIYSSSDVFITRIVAIDLDSSDRFSALKYRLETAMTNFMLNSTSGDLYFKPKEIIDQNLEIDLEITAFNQDNVNFNTVMIKIFILTNSITKNVELTNSKTSLITFNINSVRLFKTMINNFEIKCLMMIDFVYLKNFEVDYYLSFDEYVYFYKRNGYFNSSTNQISIECDSIQGLSFSFNIFFIKNTTIQKLTMNKALHYYKNQNDLISSNYILKIDQLFDLDISFNYFIVYSLQSNEINDLFIIDSFNGKIHKRDFNSTKINQIIKNSNLIKMNIEASLFSNRHEQKSIIPVYIHLDRVYSISPSIFKLKRKIDNILNDLNHKFVKLDLKNVNHKCLLTLNGEFFSAGNRIVFSIEKILKIGFEYDDEVAYENNDLFSIIQQDETNLIFKPENLIVNKEFMHFFQVYIKVCPQIAFKILISECVTFYLSIEIEITFDIEKINFINQSFEFSFDWNNISFNSPLLDLKELIENKKYINFEKNLLKFDINSNSSVVVEQAGLIYIQSNYFKKSLQLSVDLLTTSDNVLSNIKLNLNFLNKTNQINLNVKLENDILNEDLSLLHINETNKSLEIICLTIDQTICNNVLKYVDQYLILNLKVAKKNFGYFMHLDDNNRQIQLFLKTNKVNLYTVYINISKIIQKKEIQYRTFDAIKIVNIIKSTAKNVELLLDNQNYSNLRIIRVKNIVTNNEVLALDYEFKSKMNYSYLKINDANSLELSQIYSFDFNISKNGNIIQSSLYSIRLNQFDIKSINKSKQFISFFCDDSLEEQLILNLIKFEDTNENLSGGHFMQKIYLISSYSNLKIEYFQIYGDKLYLTNSHNECKKILSSESSLFILKFYIDKISLRIKKIVEIELVIEILQSQKQIILNSYHHLVELKKSSLLERNNETIYEFDLKTNEYEYKIDYESNHLNLPFEIDQYTGKVNYLISEDIYEYDLDGEKYFNFDILIASKYTIAKFNFEFILINDDPIVFINENSLEVKFYIENKTLLTKKIIGKIDLPSLFQSNKQLFKFFQYSKSFLNYIIEDSISLFELNKLSGLLTIKNTVESFKNEYYFLNVKVNGTVGKRIVIISINVLIFIQKEIQSFSLKKEYDFYLNYFEQNFQLIDTHNLNMEVRFKIMNANNICEINWLTGILHCLANKFNSNNTILNVLIIFKNKNKNKIENAQYVKVRIHNFKQVKTENSIDTSSLNDEIELNLTIEQTCQSITIDFKDLLKNKYELNLNASSYRFVFAYQQESSNKISNYFSLDQYSFLLKQFRFTNTTSSKLNDTIQVIELLNDNKFRIYKLIKIQLNINFRKHKQFKFDIDYNAFNNNNFHKLVDLFEFYPIGNKSKFYLSSNQQQDNFNYDFIDLNNQLKVYLNNNQIWINKTNFHSSDIYYFYLNEKNSDCSVSLIQLNVNYKNENELALEYLNEIYTNKMHFRKHINIDQLNYGDTVLDLNELLFNFKGKIKNFNVCLESNQSTIPFDINPFDKQIIFNHLSILNKNDTYFLDIIIDKVFTIQANFILIENNCKSITFENHINNIDISLADFNNINTVFLKRLNIFNCQINSTSDSIIYQFSDSISFENSSLIYFKKNLQQLFKLNSDNGEIELVKASSQIYYDYCNKYNRLHLISLLYSIYAFDKNTESKAEAFLKLNINCDYLKENAIQFEQSSYTKVIFEDTKIGSFILKASIRKLNNSNRANYFFCNIKMNSALLNPFSIDQNTGDIYLNNNLKSSNYILDVCANIENMKTIKTNIKISFISNTVFDYILFNKQNEILEIDIPIKKNGDIKLFQFKSNRKLYYSCETSNSNLFTINSTDGWLHLNMIQEFMYQQYFGEHLVKIIVKDNFEFNKEFKFKFNLIPSESYLIKITKEEIFDLKDYFNTTYKYLVVENNQYFTYNSTNGLIYLKDLQLKSIVKKIQFNLKLISLDSDLTIGIIQLNPRVSFTKEIIINNIYISKYSQINSTIYSLNDQSDRIIELIEMNESTLSVGADLQKVYLNKYLDQIKTDTKVVYLNSLRQSITLNIYIIENLYANLEFNKSTYYFNCSLLNNDSNIGGIEFNSNYKLLMRVNDQIKYHLAKVTNLFCLSTNTSYINNLFYLNKNMNLFINDSFSEVNCKIFQMLVEVRFTDGKQIFTNVYIELEKILHKYETNHFQSISDITDLLDYNSNGWKSINLFEIIKYEKISKKYGSKLKLNLNLLNIDEDLIDFVFNDINGILSINIASVKYSKVLHFKMNVLIKNDQEYYSIQQYDISILVKDKLNKTFFKSKIVESEIQFIQANKIFNDRILLLNLKKIVFGEMFSNFSLEKSFLSKALEIDENKIYFNTNYESKSIRIFFNFTFLFKVNACQLDKCESILVYLKFKALKLDKISLINEHYNLLENQIAIKTNSNFKTINLVKLKTFGEKIIFFKNNSFLYLNDSTNVLSANFSENNELISKKLEIYYGNRKIIFDVILLENSNQLISSDIDLFLFKKSNQKIFLGDFIQSNKLETFCELWSEASLNLMFMNKSCELWLNTKDLTANQLNVQVRNYDKGSFEKSSFLFLRINLFQIDYITTKYLLVKSNNRSKIYNLNKILKSRYSSYVLNEIQDDAQYILLWSASDEFSKSKINKISKFFEDLNGFGKFEVITPFEKQTSNSILHFKSTENDYFFSLKNFKPIYKSIIDTNQYKLIGPDFQFKNNNKSVPFFKNLIKFVKLSYLIFDSTDLQIDNNIWIRFMFKMNSKDSFLFDLKVLSRRLSFQITDMKLEMQTDFFDQSVIRFEKSIEYDEWYEFDMQLDQQVYLLISNFKLNLSI